MVEFGEVRKGEGWRDKCVFFFFLFVCSELMSVKVRHSEAFFSLCILWDRYFHIPHGAAQKKDGAIWGFCYSMGMGMA